GSLLSRETTSTYGNYRYIGIKLILFGIGVDFAFTYTDNFIGEFLGDNKINLVKHWNWLWPYMVP
ncbi:unnamed protein product, partial [Didymodactylos carnosus]